MSAVILPIHANTCRGCYGLGEQLGRTCRACAGSGVARADEAMRQHPAYGWGYTSHGHYRADDSPYGLGSFADTCWRAGWLQAEREAVRESIREKLEHERAFG